MCRLRGQPIIREGEEGQVMFVVETGTAVCTKEGVDNGTGAIIAHNMDYNPT